jgi:hypothetical protein
MYLTILTSLGFAAVAAYLTYRYMQAQSERRDELTSIWRHIDNIEERFNREINDVRQAMNQQSPKSSH